MLSLQSLLGSLQSALSSCLEMDTAPLAPARVPRRVMHALTPCLSPLPTSISMINLAIFLLLPPVYPTPPVSSGAWLCQPPLYPALASMPRHAHTSPKLLFWFPMQTQAAPGPLAHAPRSSSFGCGSACLGTFMPAHSPLVSRDSHSHVSSSADHFFMSFYCLFFGPCQSPYGSSFATSLLKNQVF